jgi:hypothetical protein
MCGNIDKPPRTVNAPHQLGKRTQNQVVRFQGVRRILEILGTICLLISLVFLPDMAAAMRELVW